MIHGGLTIDIKDQIIIKNCCVRSDKVLVNDTSNVWNHAGLIPLRERNKQNIFDSGCTNCRNLETAGLVSFRQGSNQGLGIFGRTDLSGPVRLDLQFSIDCNLACRTCGPHSSTFWRKHLKKHNQWSAPIVERKNKDLLLEILSNIDLTNLRQVVFCGGETLMGAEYWQVSQWLIDRVPNAKQNLTICFQTNGTQSIDPKYYDIIDRTHLVKLQVSLDGTGSKFDYLRWPANWSEVTENLFDLRENVPSNVMFLVEQTISVFNILDIKDVEDWVSREFSTNLEGDAVDCTRHFAIGIFGLENASRELINESVARGFLDLATADWDEDVDGIKNMLAEIKKFDIHRAQSLESTFPEMVECYKRFW